MKKIPVRISLAGIALLERSGPTIHWKQSNDGYLDMGSSSEMTHHSTEVLFSDRYVDKYSVGPMYVHLARSRMLEIIILGTLLEEKTHHHPRRRPPLPHFSSK